MVLTPQVDIHCHLLPDWDDGPPTLNDALQMAEHAFEGGVRIVFATPHVDREGISRPDRPSREAPSAARRLQLAVRDASIDLRVLSGAEVTLSPGLPARLQDEPWLCLGWAEDGGEVGKQYVLVELPPGAPWTADVDEVLFQIALRGVVPILAHPERYPDVQRDLSIARRAAERGVLLQVTARALSATGSSSSSSTARELALDGLVSFVASDSHSLSYTAPAQAAASLCALLGEEAARRILEENPRRLLEGGVIAPGVPSLSPAPRLPLLQRLLGSGRSGRSRPPRSS